MNGIQLYRRSGIALAGFLSVSLAGCSGQPQPVPDREPSTQTRAYQVDGDSTLAGVAQEFGVEVSDLVESNPDLPDRGLLETGTELQVPVASDSHGAVPTLQPDVPESSAYSGTFHLLLDLSDEGGSWLNPVTQDSGDKPEPPDSGDKPEPRDSGDKPEPRDSVDEPGPPRLFFVEHYHLTNFVSDYGTGRIIKTFSLMPGEKAQLSISSFTREALKANDASSVLDSYSEETLEDFEKSVRAEQTGSSTSTESKKIKASASASASWGWGEAKASGSYSKASSEARSRFASNVASATAKNTARASAARNVEINTSVERSRETEETESTYRTVENINLDRTLNFIFYQMNQRYVSLIHLTEIELGYDDGNGNLTVVPLYEMRALLERVVKEAKVDEAQSAIFNALREIRDYRGRKVEGFITEDAWLSIGDKENPSQELSLDKAKKVQYLRVNHDYVSSFEELGTGREYFVDGVLLEALPLILRTDGVYVESLLGQTTAWSPHTEKIKAEELKALQIKNDLLKKGL
jgi:hypothetical protein